MKNKYKGISAFALLFSLFFFVSVMSMTAVYAEDIADVSFVKEGGAVTITAEYSDSLSGKVIYVLRDDNDMKDVAVQDINPEGNEYTFQGCESNQEIKVLFWNDAEYMMPIQEAVSVKVEDVKKAPDILTVNSDGYLAKKNGTVVQLKGVNFGGWLIQETWMCPVLPYDGSVMIKSGAENGWANLDTLNKFEELFGKEEAAKLIKQYQDNYITEQDFKNVAYMGLNCVRIPFWYRNFMSDENGTYITANDDDNPGFQKLDWACDMAEKYGLYLIFDMHGCPGGQGGDHSTGKVGRNYLYMETKYQDIMEDLWVKIAKRYKNRECVAAYDIMNEPLNNADADHNVASKYILSPWNDSNTGVRVQLYDRMIKAIRKVDTKHAITVEGIWRLYLLPKPSDKGWTNMIYQLHSYDSDQSTTSELVTSLDNYRKWYKVAGLMGEFNPIVYYNGIVDLMNDKKVSYTMWNYKTGYVAGDYSGWGLYYHSYSGDIYNICGTNITLANKIAQSWDSSAQAYTISKAGLSASEMKEFYTKWWTSKFLSTSKFTQNTTMKGYLK